MDMEHPQEIPAPIRQTMDARAKANAARQEEVRQKRIAMRKVFDRLANTPDGKEALKFIHQLSGHNISPIRTDNEGRTNLEVSLALQGRIDLYLDLRPFIPAKVVAEIEEFVHNESEKI